jgi:chaperonin GroES
MIEASKEVSSVQDVLTGEQAGANQSPTTTLSLIEQGLKVFSSIYDRIHRSLKSEFQKVWRLNRLYLDPEYYRTVLDDPEAAIEDFYDKDMDVIPVSNESELSHTQKMVKAEALMGMVGTGLNDREIQKRYLEALNIEDAEKVLPPEGQQEQVPPEMQVEMAKLEIEKGKLEIERIKAESNAALIESKIRKNDADIKRSEATARNTEQQALKDEHMEKLDSLTKVVQMQTSTIEKLASKIIQSEKKQEEDKRKKELEKVKEKPKKEAKK